MKEYKEVKTHGEIKQYGGGALRDENKGKGAYWLLPGNALARIRVAGLGSALGFPDDTIKGVFISAALSFLDYSGQSISWQCLSNIVVFGLELLGREQGCSQEEVAFTSLNPGGVFRLARHFENGADKYTPRNWEKGIPISRFTDSMVRHGFNYLEGKDDEDHLAACVWNAVCLYETRLRINSGILPIELDDLWADRGGHK